MKAPDCLEAVWPLVLHGDDVARYTNAKLN
jgi:hypothetical protein